MLDAVKDTLNSMNETERKVIEYCYFNHLRIFEIAIRLNCSERLVSIYKNKALKNFAPRFIAMQVKNGIDEKNIFDLTKTKEVA